MFDAWWKAELPKVYADHSPDLKEVLQRCPKLTTQQYKPFPFMTNPHFETIFAAWFRKAPAVDYRREILIANDGGQVALDWEQSRSKSLSADAPLLVLLPGLTGGSGDTYIRHAVEYGSRLGYRMLVFNGRGTADSPVTTPQYYSASFTGDAKEVIRHARSQYPSAPLLAMGWSLGANILIKYMAEVEDECPLAAAVSLCNPFELGIANHKLQQGFSKVYDINLGKSLSRIHRKHLAVWDGVEGKFKPDVAANAGSIREFDDAITIHSFGWPSTDVYYKESSSCYVIPHVKRRCLCIQALDDPIAPKEAIPYEAISQNPNTALVTTPYGGHLGWVAGEGAPFGRPWSTDASYEFLGSALEQWRKDQDAVRERNMIGEGQTVTSLCISEDDATTPVSSEVNAVAQVSVGISASQKLE